MSGVAPRDGDRLLRLATFSGHVDVERLADVHDNALALEPGEP